MVYRVVIFLVSLFLLLGCSGGRHDARLEHVAGIVSDSPREALPCLDSIDYKSLSTRDRHYYDFLSLKAKDKDYIVHESDSLILDLLKYYSSDKGMYPEVLYYGGRVYSDLGDYPTALRYFQTALDEFDDDSGSLSLKSNILSQTGRLLNSLRLHRQAVPYLQESLGVDSILKDTFGLAYDHLLLGDIYDKTGEYDRAEIAFHKAYNWGEMISPSHAANACIYLASAKLHKGKVDSALNIIRPISGDIRPAFRNAYLALGSDAYYRAGIYDTAYIYAHELVLSSDPNNRKTGFRMMLTPELRKYIPNDSVDLLHNLYKTTVDAYIDSHEGEQAVAQNSMYNYSIHERERAKAEKDKQTIYRLLVVALVIIFVGLLCFFVYRYISKLKIIHLQRSLFFLLGLKSNYKSVHDSKLLACNGDTGKMEVPKKKILLLFEPNNVYSLRNRLLKELGDINEKLRSKPIAPKEYFESDVSETVREYLKCGRVIPEGKQLWEEIEKIVLNESGNFKTNLMLLSDGKVDDFDYRMALLLRCGLCVTDISKLMGRAKATISKRRLHLGKKLFGEDLDTKSLVTLIRLL